MAWKSGVAMIFLLGLVLPAGGQAQDQRPTLNILSIEPDLRTCIAGQVQTKIDAIRVDHDLARKIKTPHLELVVYCEGVNVNLRDQTGNLSQVPITSCATILSENPGQNMAGQLTNAKTGKKVDLTGITRRMAVQSTAGQMAQHCRAISNSMIPKVFQWLGQGSSFK